MSRIRILVVFIIWIVILSGVLFWFLAERRITLTVAAGPRDGEAFHLLKTVAEVFNAEPGPATLEVYETSGSAENARLIEDGRVDLATVQADTQVGGRAGAVAILYRDAYQLIARNDSGIGAFSDLKDRRVAIPPPSSGQNKSFWFVARHFGVKPEDLTALSMSEDAADFAMVMGQVDAVFRVRAPGNPSIETLVSDHPMHLVPIPQADALALRLPAIAPGVIPVGTYRGAPPLPERDLPTAILQRILIARRDLSPHEVLALTRTLFERHSALVARNHLAGFIRPIDLDSNISMPLHPGSRQYYDREKPSFLQRNTRLMASLLYVIAILSSAGLALRSHLQRKKRVRIGDYTAELMNIVRQARETNSPERLESLKDELLGMLQQLLQDLDRNRVTQDEFEHFSFTWRAADIVIRDRMTLAAGRQGGTDHG